MTNTTAAASKTEKPLLTLKQITLAGLMSAVFCLLGPLSLNIPLSPVPVSLGMLAIYFVTSVLGMKLGFFSVLAYILLGLAGVPVFTGFTGGAGKLLGPTGGYIIGYIFMALICGFFVDNWGNQIIPEIIGMVLGTAVCYLFGTLWLAYQASYTFFQALAAGVLPYIPVDAVKLAIALVVGRQIRARLLKAGLL